MTVVEKNKVQDGAQMDQAAQEKIANDEQQPQALTDELQPENPVNVLHLDRMLHPLAVLLQLDSCEIFLREKRAGELMRVYHLGSLSHIWKPQPPAKSGELFPRQMIKGEARVINLPDRRVKELNPEIKEKAFGQVICCPVLVNHSAIGFLCAVHTRRNLLTDSELGFLRSVGEWLGDMIATEQKNQQLRARILSEERKRIGMDLHDGIIQSLYGISLSIENARLSLDQDMDSTRKLIASSLLALQSATADIRAYILNLRPRQLRHSNLFQGMQSLLREFRANTMIEVELDGHPEASAGLASEQTDALYHIFQEALSNIAKHAKATCVSVRLWRREDRLMLRVNDNGMGFYLPKSSRRAGQGMGNMQVRAESAGGGIEIISIRKQGTTLTAWVPWVEKEQT